MEEKMIVGVITAFILVITASFMNSENLSKSQKVILFCLIIFPPAQWIVGIIFLKLNNNKFKIDKNKSSFYEVKNNLNIQQNFNKKQVLLEKSLEMNLISKIEFESKIKKLEKEKNDIEIELKESKKIEESIIVLKKLYKNNIITEEELNTKIKILEKEKLKERNIYIENINKKYTQNIISDEEISSHLNNSSKYLLYLIILYIILTIISSYKN